MKKVYPVEMNPRSKKNTSGVHDVYSVGLQISGTKGFWELFVSFIFLLHVFFSFFRIISLKNCNFVPITKQYKENEANVIDGCSRLNDYG